MSKQSDAKEAQGYNTRPLSKTCANCAHFKKEVEEYIGWDKQKYSIEKNLRCGIGGFAVKKTATCNMYKEMDND